MIRKLISLFLLFLWFGVVSILFPFHHFWTNYNSFFDVKKISKSSYFDMYEEIAKENPGISAYAQSVAVHKTANEYGLSKWKDWINSLSSFPWDNNNFFSNSESQSLYLYAIEWGDFWNVPLHKREEPKDSILRSKIIRGQDWKYLNKALTRAVSPDYLVVYHGVEFMEDEFWDQLKDYVVQPDGYVWKNAIGKTIESYGFISATFAKDVAIQYDGGYNWTNGSTHLPLQEPTVFKIYIPKGISGVAYVSGFILAGICENPEAQVMFKKDSKYQIFNYEKNGKNNIFSVYYLG